MDLTDRMVTERALRFSEQSYRSLVEEAPYAICRSTISGQLLQVNRAMLEILGYDAASEAELLIRDLPLIFASPDDFLSFRRALLQAGTCRARKPPGSIATAARSKCAPAAVRCATGGRNSDPDVVAENNTEKKQAGGAA